MVHKLQWHNFLVFLSSLVEVSTRDWLAKKVFDPAQAVFQADVIRDKACNYLIQWARGTRQRPPRPAHYHFLTHRVHNRSKPNGAASDLPAAPHDPRPVVVAALGGDRNLPVEAEPDDDHERGPLVISSCTAGKNIRSQQVSFAFTC